jgi:hypothetical protein
MVRKVMKNGGICAAYSICDWTNIAPAKTTTGLAESWISIGGLYGVPSFNFLGSLDDIRIYSTYLTDPQLISIYKNQILSPSLLTGLEFHVDFRHQTLTDNRLVYDLSTNYRHLTMYGQPNWELTSNTNCRPLPVLDCTANDDGHYVFTTGTQYAQQTLGVNVAFAVDMSFSIWIKRQSQTAANIYALSVGASNTAGTLFRVGFTSANKFIFGFGSTSDWDTTVDGSELNTWVMWSGMENKYKFNNNIHQHIY